MWIQKSKSGTYRYFERYEDPLTGISKIASVTAPSRSRSDQNLARQSLEDKIAQLTAASVYTAANDTLTLADLVELYEAYQKETVAASTYQRNHYACNTIKKLLGKDTLVSRITAGYVKQAFAAGKTSPGKINERYTRYKALMRWAYSNDYVDDIQYLDKLTHVKDVKKKEKLEEKFFEKKELQKVLEHMAVDHWCDVATFMSLSGLRCGEALALELSDLDFENGVICVTKTYDFINRVVTPPKTACSVRQVHMQPELRTLCIALRKKALERRLGYGHHSELLFADKNGEYRNYYAFNKYLKRISLACTGYAATTHVLRHTHASLLAEAGIPLETIMRRLGHENSDVTEEVYLHVTDKMIERDNQFLDNVKLMA